MKSRTLFIGVLILGIGLVLLGGVGGILIPILSSSLSGETVFQSKLSDDQAVTVELTPAMNPIRAYLNVSLERPGQNRGGHGSSVTATMHKGEEAIWEVSTGFSDNDAVESGGFVSARKERRTVLLQEFVVNEKASYEVETTVTLHESFNGLGNELEILANVQPMNWQQVLWGSGGIVFGIAIILFSAWRLVRRVELRNSP